MKVMAVMFVVAICAIGQGLQINNGDSQATGPVLKGQMLGSLEVLTDTHGVDLTPYLSKMFGSVRQNWFAAIPQKARVPELKKGAVAIEFVILRSGTLTAMRITQSSGDIEMDRAAWGGIATSAPFAPLPAEFHGEYLSLRLHFKYNPDKRDALIQKPDQH